MHSKKAILGILLSIGIGLAVFVRLCRHLPFYETLILSGAITLSCLVVWMFFAWLDEKL